MISEPLKLPDTIWACCRLGNWSVRGEVRWQRGRGLRWGVVRDTCDFSTLPPPCHHCFLDLVIQEGSLSDQKAGSPAHSHPGGSWFYSQAIRDHTPSGPVIQARTALFGFRICCIRSVSCFSCILYLSDNLRSSQVLMEIFQPQHLGRDKKILLGFLLSYFSHLLYSSLRTC